MAATNQYRTILGRNISGERGRLQLRQTAVAERMSNLGFGDWRQQTVANIEKGKRRLTVEELLGLAEALETTLARLLAATDGFPFVELPSESTHQMPTAEINRLADGGRGGVGVIRWDGNALARNLPGEGEVQVTHMNDGERKARVWRDGRWIAIDPDTLRPLEYRRADSHAEGASQ
jgi:transcriptional regulator with XRE-family HTH domain